MKQTAWNFMGIRYITFLVSTLLIIASITFVVINSLNFSIDFTGGTAIEVRYQEEVNIPEIKETLADIEYNNAIVQYFGSSKDISIKLPPKEDNVSQDKISVEIFNALAEKHSDIELLRVYSVGASVGEELTETGSLAVLYALVGILIYIAFRFEFRFALGAVMALIHDVIIVLGVFALFQFDFDLSVLAALLAVIGYSLNDTIVVFDRIREMFLKLRKTDPITVINISIQKTLARTLVTSLTTLLVLIALFIYGGETLKGFSLALILGVVVGTYSSIYIASAFALILGIRHEVFLPIEEEAEKAN